ncbi:MAG: NAD(P)/FAD-dependent oxidoreductase [Sphingobacteriales bacterium]|nr:NAD(P)/FAD-dependent oxidoreductase [Sphingobacteriales bacterium]
MEKRLVIIGGGAAGFFCAVNAARMNPALKVIILEKGNKLLSKVKISGGGRCNLAHACFDIAEMSRNYPRGANFVKKAFHQFFTTDTIKWFEERNVKLKTEKDGRIFPVSDSSQTVVDCLLREANKYGVEILLNREVVEINTQQSTINIQFSNKEIIKADYVCIASGGYPKSSMFKWLQDTGHSIEDPVPSLFTFNLSNHPITKLMGISVEEARVKITGTKLEQKGPLLITHWGLSGPAILKFSAFAARDLKERNWKFEISINWLPDFNEQSLKEKFSWIRKENASQKIVNKNPFRLPARLWEFLCIQSAITDTTRWADLSLAVQNKFIKNICAYECHVKGKTTFKEEFVTAGGIKLNEVDVNTMMSKKVPGLFFAGEVLDVDGITGGFNFQHAWTSGFIAAKSIAALSK